MPAWNPRANEIFLAALDIEDVSERRSHLDAACGDDAELRRQVEALLAAHQEAGSFLQASPATADFPAEAQTIPPRIESPGTQIGPYKLLELIGEGGMGAVWLAEQREPVRRRVALKVIKAGMGSAQVIARFEAERQALALMDHPNIAKVLDGGTSAGRPYFVMELVKGTPITSYCDQHRLTPAERLQLFVQVCQAVQHAHQKGIIHRDLKPSNVLVAPFDGRPVVKVIDFGVAKAVGQQLTERTMFTGFGAMIGTLQYMSPEQAELNNQDIDTRSDIYSLGVMLYELLTGSTPLDMNRLRGAAMAAMLMVVHDEEPPKPSTRLSEWNDSLPSIAAQRHMEPAKLTRLVRGELDWIVMKALSKDRSRRYESANGLARDIGRYLANEPVEAGPPSNWYRMRKYLQRNPKWVGLFVWALILAVFGVVAWINDGSQRDEQIAKRAKEQEEINKYHRSAQMLIEFLEGALVNPPAGQSLDKEAKLSLVAQAEHRLILILELENRYTAAEIRAILGSVCEELGQSDRALSHRQQALNLVRQEYGPTDWMTVKFNTALADLHLMRNEPAEAQQLCESALDEKAKWRAGDDSGWFSKKIEADLSERLGAALAAQSNFAKGEELLVFACGRQAVPKERRRCVERLVKLYETWDKPNEAAKWRKELEAMKAQNAKPEK